MPVENRLSVSLLRVELLHVFEHQTGFMYSAPIDLDGDTVADPSVSKLLLFEDGRPLRRGHAQHATISGTGQGAYSHWGRHILFSASDNSDPNTNGRSYSYAIDHVGQSPS